MRSIILKSSNPIFFRDVIFRHLVSKTDLSLAFMLFILTSLAYGFYAPNLGFHYDDSGWLIKVVAGQKMTIWHELLTYIPGRNLFVLWFHSFLRLAGDPMTHLPELHFLLSILDGLLVGMFFLVLRALCVGGAASVLAAGMFAFWPLHGETHYWMNDLPENLMSSFWLFIFCLSSISLVKNPKSISAWCIDIVSLLCTLFTYEQPFFFIIQIIIVRIGINFYLRGRSSLKFIYAHIPYAIFCICYVAMKMGIRDGESPTLPGNLPEVILRNIIATTRSSFGDPFFQLTQSFFEHTTINEIIIACVVALVIGVISLFWSKEKGSIEQHIIWIGIAFSFYCACYLPVWIWYPAARHNLLPSIPLFFGVSIALDLLIQKVRFKLLQSCVIGCSAAVIAYFAIAGLSESYFWKNAYVAKARMLKDLCPELLKHDTLVLENFPATIGSSTPVIAFQDSRFAPQLLCPDLLRDHTFAGDLGATIAPGGTFLGVRRMTWGEENFSFRKNAKPLFVRFNGLEVDKFNYEIVTPPFPQYEVISINKSTRQNNDSEFASSAERINDGVMLSISTPVVAAKNHLAALVHYISDGNRKIWNQWEDDNALLVHPIVLAPSSTEDEHTILNVKLKQFPITEKIEITFYEVYAEGAPKRLQTVSLQIRNSSL